MSATGWIALGLVNIPLYVIIGRVFFTGWDDFGESIAFLIKPDLLSALHGEFFDDWWAEMKLAAFIGVCGMTTWIEGTQIVIPHVLPLFS